MRVLIFEAPLGDHAVDLDQQLLVVPGLGEIVVGAQFERVHSRLHRAVGRDHEDGGFTVALADVAQHVHARPVGHHQIEQHQVVGAGLDFAYALGAVDGQVHTVAFQAEECIEAFPYIQRVSDYQNFTLGYGGGQFGRSHL